MDAGVLVGITTKILFLTVLGYVLRKTRIINDEVQKGLGGLLINVIMPCSVLASGSRPYEREMLNHLLLMMALVAGYYIVAMVLMPLLVKPLPMPGKNKAMMANIAIFGNVGYIGIPVIQSLYGSEGVLYTVIYSLFFQLTAFTWGVWKLGGKDISVGKLFLQPATLAAIFAVVMFVSPFTLPWPLVESLESVGNMSAPVALFVIGSSLAKLRLPTLFTDGWAWLSVFLRQVLSPFLGGVVLVLLGVKGIMPATFLILTGIPSAAANVIFAEKYDQDVPFAAKAVSLGTLMMLPLLPLSGYIAGRLFF